MKRIGAVHREVAKVAREAAGQHYEVLMKDNLLHELWKKQNPGLTPKQLESRFIEKSWQLYIRFARTTMGLLLGRPDVSEEVKQKVYEALVEDGKLTVGRYTAEEAAYKLREMIPQRPCGIPVPRSMAPLSKAIN